MKNSLLLMGIYKRYLQITSDLITILENTFKAEKNEVSSELKEKRKEFRKHAHSMIESLNIDMHKLLSLDWELKRLEDNENNKVK